jgi:peptidoglycan hydrolase CwlO-like protein
MLVYGEDVNMTEGIILIISNALTALASFFMGKRRSNAETDNQVLRNLELSVNLYRGIIEDLKTEIESLNIKIQELERKVDLLHEENKSLRSKTKVK